MKDAQPAFMAEHQRNAFPVWNVSERTHVIGIRDTTVFVLGVEMPKNTSKIDRREIRAIIKSATACFQNNDIDQAIQILESGTKRYKRNVEIPNLLAEVHARSGNFIVALRLLDQLILTKLADGETWEITARLLASALEFAQAADAFENCLEFGADADVYHEYGRALFKLGRISLAAKQIEKAIELGDDIHYWQSLATLAPGNPAYSHKDVLAIRNAYASRLERPSASSPAQLGTATDGKSRSTATKNPRAELTRQPVLRCGEKIRVGYLSAWFHRENYMKPVWALLNSHDRSRFEVHLFSDETLDQNSGFQKQVNDKIHDTRDLSNEAICEAVTANSIDILVDLNAYSTPKRLGVFLKRPAPITVAWFNMFATSGFRGFDFIIGDEWTVSSEEEVYYGETVVRLPQSYLSFSVTHNAPDIVDPPCSSNGYIAFGSLVPMYKITDPVVHSWSKILEAVPGSRLLLGNALLDSACNREYLASRFKSWGIEQSRLEFRGSAPHREFLKNYDSIDIALDAFPYSGGTTTMEAIWQGVPVITFAGDRWASRTSASILNGTHLKQFVAADVDEYARLCQELAASRNCDQYLSRMRHSMRDKLLRSRVCNPKRFAFAMENAFENMIEANAASGLCQH